MTDIRPMVFILRALSFLALMTPAYLTAEGLEKMAISCDEEYGRSPSYRMKSPRQQDLDACKGVVGESFCIEEKEALFLEKCKARKPASTPPPPSEPMDVKPEEPDPEGESKAPESTNEPNEFHDL